MAEGSTSLRDISLHEFGFDVSTFQTTKNRGNVSIKTVSVRLPCTEEQAREVRGLAAEAYMKNKYLTFANNAYDVRVTGTDWEQVYRTFLEKLLLAVKYDRDVTWTLGAVIT